MGTNTIRQNYSRIGGLDYIVANKGVITDAVSSQVWSGDAVVHVSIVNWMKGKFDGTKLLYNQLGDNLNSPWDVKELNLINSSLSAKIDVISAKILKTNKNASIDFHGQTHGHAGFLLSVNDAKILISKDKTLREVLFPYLIGRELVGNISSQPKRFVIDFSPRSIIDSKKYKTVFEIVENKVLSARKKSIRERRKTK